MIHLFVQKLSKHVTDKVCDMNNRIYDLLLLLQAAEQDRTKYYILASWSPLYQTLIKARISACIFLQSSF